MDNIESETLQEGENQKKKTAKVSDFLCATMIDVQLGKTSLFAHSTDDLDIGMQPCKNDPTARRATVLACSSTNRHGD